MTHTLSQLLLPILLLTAPPILLPAISAPPPSTPATLPSTPSTTSQPADPLQTALLELLAKAGVTVTAATQQDSVCTITSNMTTARLTRSLESLKTSELPVRQDYISIRAPKPGTDNLAVEMRFTLNVPKGASILAMDVFRDLTVVFAQNFPGPNTIWLTSLTLDTTQVSYKAEGQCTSDKIAQDLQAAMQKSDRFQSIVLTTLPDPAHPGEFTFRLSFLYKPVPTTIPTASAPATSAPATQEIPPYKFRAILTDDVGPIALFEITERDHAAARYFRIGDTFFDGSKITEINGDGVIVTDAQGRRPVPLEVPHLPPLIPLTRPSPGNID